MTNWLQQKTAKGEFTSAEAEKKYAGKFFKCPQVTFAEHTKYL